MRVAIVSGTWPPHKCGVGDYLSRFAATIASRGLTVEIVTSTGAGRFIPDAAVDHLSMKERTAARRNLRVHPEVREWTVSGVRPALDRVTALAPDLVHVQYPTLVYEQRLGINLFALKLRLRHPRLPVITTLHEFAQYGILGRWRLAPNLLLGRAACVTSPEERDTVARTFPLMTPQLRVIPVGSAIAVSGSRAEGLRLLRRLGVGRNDRTIVYFGWAGPRKGLPQLYEAVRHLWDRDIPVKLVVAAARLKHPLHVELARQARELEIMDLVKWTGFLPERDVSSVLMAAEVGVLPFEDGAKLNRSTLIAELIHGIPVVTTRGPALRHLRGADITPCDPTGESIADAVISVLRRPKSRRAATRRPAPAVRPFGWDRIADRYLALYRELLRGR